GPLLVFAGDEDPAGEFGEAMRDLVARYERFGIGPITLRLYPHGRHEMLNETNRDEVHADLVAWLGASVGGGGRAHTGRGGLRPAKQRRRDGVRTAPTANRTDGDARRRSRYGARRRRRGHRLALGVGSCDRAARLRLGVSVCTLGQDADSGRCTVSRSR